MKILTAKVGNLLIGGGNPVVVQTMCNTHTADIEASYAQCERLARAGAQMIRLTTPSVSDVEALGEIRKRLRANGIDTPLVADIHFDYRLAIAAIEHGADKIRINPGNIGSEENVRKVAEACRIRNIPIRIGVNAGSLAKQAEDNDHLTPRTHHRAPKRKIFKNFVAVSFFRDSRSHLSIGR